MVALDQQWHIWCFKCGTCGTVLHGEYMGKDGIPYCERDYQKQFGVKCAYCNRFISGKVLQVFISFNILFLISFFILECNHHYVVIYSYYFINFRQAILNKIIINFGIMALLNIFLWTLDHLH